MTRKAKKGNKRKRQKAGLNRSILDVGWSGLTKAIQYKLEEGEGVFVEVPTKTVKPSQTCPKCLHQKKKDLSERIHCCEKCGYIQDRDIAAASVMVLWAVNSGEERNERPQTWRLKLYFFTQGTKVLRRDEATGVIEAFKTPSCWRGLRNPVLSVAGRGSS